MSSLEKLYRCGDCPVCSYLSDLVLLQARRSGALFVFCPSCGCAFDGPPNGVEYVVAPDAFAPHGFSAPDREAVRVAIDRGWLPRYLAVLDAEWTERLGPGLSDANRPGAGEPAG